MARKRLDRLIAVIIAISTIIFIGFIIMIVWGISDRDGGGMELSHGSKVAVVDLFGVIYDSRDVVWQFEKYRKDKSIKAIVFHINSPGGGVAASQEIYEAVKFVRDSGKPIVASMSSVAASGGYYAALGASRIMANPGTTTGSIGVIAEFPNFSGLLSKIGVDYTIIKSGEFKDTGNPYRDLTPKERKYLQGWIDDAYQQFLTTVATARQKPVDEIRPYANGRVFTGSQAFNNGLIDTLGTFRDAVKLAAALGGIKGEPKLVKKRKKRRVTFFDLLFQDVSRFLPEQGAYPKLKYQWSF